MKHTAKMIVNFDRDYAGEIRYHLFCCDMSSLGYTPVCEVDVEFETPDDFNPIVCEVASLKETKQKIQATAQMEITRIEEKIQSLLALPSP